MSGSGGSRPVLLLRVGAGASVGSLAAVVAVVLTRTITHPRLVDGMALGVTAFCVLTVAVLTSGAEETRPVGVPPSYTGSMPRPAPAQPVSTPPQPVLPPRPVPVPRPPAPVPPAPTSPAATGPAWYDAAARGVAGQAEAAPAVPSALGPGPTRELPGPSGPRHVEIALSSAPDAGSGVRQIVQCPRCGAFAVDGRRVRRGCAFACAGCGHTWHITLDAPWPVTVVRPRLTRSGPGVSDPDAPPVWHLNG